MEAVFIKKRDFILIFMLLIAAAVSYGIWYFRDAGERECVVVSVDKEQYAKYSLLDDGTYTIDIDGEYNIVKISSGYVSVTDASCPDKICVHEKAINKGGQSIICLPNKMVVTIVKNTDNDEIDGVVK